VATFTISGKQKQGGNVAGYFCTPAGLVLHAVAGPVDAHTFLQEARWANETYQLAQLEQVPPGQLAAFFRKAHLERLEQEHKVSVPQNQLPLPGAFTPELLVDVLDQNDHLHLSDQGKVHLLLVVAPTPPLHEVYRAVFEEILNEKISTSPVAVAGN
jgi:hypothetical protein